MESVLAFLLPSSAPRRERHKINFVVSVSRGAGLLHTLGDEDMAGAGSKGYLNVAMATLLQAFSSHIAAMAIF